MDESPRVETIADIATTTVVTDIPTTKVAAFNPSHTQATGAQLLSKSKQEFAQQGRPAYSPFSHGPNVLQHNRTFDSKHQSSAHSQKDFLRPQSKGYAQSRSWPSQSQPQLWMGHISSHKNSVPPGFQPRHVHPVQAIAQAAEFNSLIVQDFEPQSNRIGEFCFVCFIMFAVTTWQF